MGKQGEGGKSGGRATVGERAVFGCMVPLRPERCAGVRIGGEVRGG